MAARVGDAGGTSSARRRERRLCSWWRHEAQSVAAALATARHHSAGPPVVTRREEQQEEDIRDEYQAPREQTRPPPGTRLAPLSDVARPQQAAVTVGYVAAGAPSLVVAPVAAHDGLDAATVQLSVR